jgi:hypothetical protein
MLENYTRHQQGIIKRYYEHFDKIQLQKLSELVTDLYLAEGTKKDKLWQSAATAMQKLKVPQSRIDHILGKKDLNLLAALVKEISAA